jgi:hypothetical protein
MSSSFFDFVKEEAAKDPKSYSDLAKNAPSPKDNSFFGSVADYSKTILKGVVEGTTRLGRMFGPAGDIPSEQLYEQQTEELNKLLPTDEGFGQTALRRGLRETPSMLAFPGAAVSTIPKAIAAGFIGEGAKELGAPEWAQTALEITSFAGPDLTKKLLEKGKNKDIIEFGKKMGFTDEQIAPLLNSEFKQKWLTKIAPKRGATEKALQNTKNQLSQTYGLLQKSETAALELSEKENGKLINALTEKLNEMPRELRAKIEPDLKDLLENKITGKSLINFYKDIGSHFAENTKQLSLLKDPVKDALISISPELGADFELLNKLYTKYYPIAKRLKPNITSDIISAAETLGILGSVFQTVTMGSPHGLYLLLGEKAGRKVAQQLLINPRLQQISKRIGQSLNENKFGITKKLLDVYSNEVKKISPELAQSLEDISEEDLKKIFNHSHQKSS